MARALRTAAVGGQGQTNRRSRLDGERSEAARRIRIGPGRSGDSAANLEPEWRLERFPAELGAFRVAARNHLRKDCLEARVIGRQIPESLEAKHTRCAIVDCAFEVPGALLEIASQHRILRLAPPLVPVIGAPRLLCIEGGLHFRKQALVLIDLVSLQVGVRERSQVFGAIGAFSIDWHLL